MCNDASGIESLSGMAEYQEKVRKHIGRATEKGKPPPKTHPRWPVAMKAQKLQADIGYAVKQMEEQRVLLDLSLEAAEKILIGMDDGFRVRSDVTDDGVIVYEFPEIRHRPKLTSGA